MGVALVVLGFIGLVVAFLGYLWVGGVLAGLSLVGGVFGAMERRWILRERRERRTVSSSEFVQELRKEGVDPVIAGRLYQELSVRFPIRAEDVIGELRFDEMEWEEALVRCIRESGREPIGRSLLSHDSRETVKSLAVAMDGLPMAGGTR